MPYREMYHQLTVDNGNYTYFNRSRTLPLTFDSSFAVNIVYNRDDGNTTFYMEKAALWLGDTVVTSAIPSPYIGIQGDVPFTAEVEVVNFPAIRAKEESTKTLSPILRYIQEKANSFLPGWASDGLLAFLRMIDILIFLLGLTIAGFYNYPYLIFVWSLTLNNIIVSFKTSTLSEFITEYINNYIGIVKFGVDIVSKIVMNAVLLLKFLRQLLQL